MLGSPSTASGDDSRILRVCGAIEGPAKSTSSTSSSSAAMTYSPPVSASLSVAVKANSLWVRERRSSVSAGSGEDRGDDAGD
jgi:hypothetical protein